MIKPVTMYSVICDRCGKTFIDEFNGIGAWLDEGTCKEKAIVHINNVSKMIGSKRIKLSEGTTIYIQNELVLALKELED